jgi:hypothetical protein
MPSKLKTATCIFCKCEFQSRHKTVKFCSRKCSGKATYSGELEKFREIAVQKSILTSREKSKNGTLKRNLIQKHERKCEKCEKTFMSTRSFTKFCSMNCRGNIKKKAIRHRYKEYFVAYKGGKCLHCGYSKCVKALQFHHLDPKEKDFNIRNYSKSFEKQKEEVDKCILLCANCHAEEHDRLSRIS